MISADSPMVAALLPGLGYTATNEQVRQRFAHLGTRPDNRCLVSELEGKIVGWSHVYGVCLIESEGYAEIGGLVVLANYQRKGVGSQLVRACEHWAASHGYARVRLRSGAHREDAHDFYQSLGYSKSRVSFAFERNVPTIDEA